jgi:hypothetical protein
MSSKIILKKSSVASKVPVVGDLSFGELALNYTDGKLYYKNADGSTIGAFNAGFVGDVTLNGTQTLTNKTISADSNTLSGIAASSFVLSNSSGNIDGSAAQKAIPSGVVVGTTDTQTLTNKTINGSSNSITNISLTTGITGTLPVANGGTGTTSLTANNVILGNGTSAVQVVAPGTSGNVLTSNGTTWTSAAAAAGLLGVTQSSSGGLTALGYQAGNVTTGLYNTWIGYQSGLLTTTGNYNTGVGYQALDSNTTGARNTAVGSEALGANTTGARNTAIGYEAFDANIGGSDNVAVGNNALTSGTAVEQTVAVGSVGLQGLTTGGYSVAVGGAALNSQTTAIETIGVGYWAGLRITTGGYNTAVGTQSLNQVTTQSANTAVGYRALFNAASADNTAIGFQAGDSITTGANNIVIGNDADASSATVGNEITLGNSSIATLRCQVTTITSLSDARDKTNIVDLDAGLNLINAVRPVAFDWNMRDGGKVGEHDTGFIAQELQAAQEVAGVSIPGLVFDNNPEKLEAGYGKLLPVMVKAIQELSAKVDALQAELNQLKGA